MKATGWFISIVLLWCTFSVTRADVRSLHLWTFDEDTGDRAADAVGRRHGVVHGARWAAGRIGSGLWFDGMDDYVALPDNDPVWLPMEDFTISFWVYFERDKGQSVRESEVLADFNYGASTDPSNELGYNVQRRGDTGRIVFQFTSERNSDEDLYSQSVPPPHEWHHIAAVRRGTMQSLYVNGALDAWRACSSSPVDFAGGYDDNRINVGRFTTTVGEPRYHFKGVLDELIIVGRALSATDIRQLYQDSTAEATLYVDAVCGRDRNDGLRPFTAFATIQRAIDAARDGDTISVLPGIYREEIDLLGKSITVQSRADAAIIEAPDRFAVSFCMGEGPDTVLRNVIITNSYMGIFCAHSAPTITNVTVSGNMYGAEAYGRAGPQVRNSIFWGNRESDLYGCQATYSCIERNSPGLGNFAEDPLFVDAENGDWHVRSERGRYWPMHDVWVLDDVSSSGIDAGDPAADVSRERKPNGGRINVGAHGGTPYAAMSDSRLSLDTNGDDSVDTARP